MKPAARQIINGDWAPKVDVDNRIALRFYYRIAGNLLKQATIYREENDLIDLYIILLRFSGLLCETIPSHRDYRILLPKERTTFKRKLIEVVGELETLKPVVQRQFDEFNRRQVFHFDGQQRGSYSSTGTMAFPAIGKTPSRLPDEQASFRAVSQNSFNYSSGHDQFTSPGQTQTRGQMSKSYLSLPYPKEETLSRHSILGPDGLSGQWNGPITGTRVQYPSNADILQIDHLPPTSQSTLAEKVSVDDACNSDMMSVLSLDDGQWSRPENSSLSIEPVSDDLNLLNIKQPSPPPVLADVKPQKAMVSIPPSKVADPRPGSPKTLDVSVPGSKTRQQLHIPVQLMECFLRFAEKNTAKNVETCGVLAGSLKDRRFCVTTLIIPKQEGTPDSCQTKNEEEIFDYQDQRSLFPLGWIHTHPTQTCFMSSIDLHTHYSYQIMLPEAIAIVMAPTDRARKHGIFNLSDPGGISVIRNCQERGFHPHEQPSDGSPLYEHCSHVYMNPNLKFESVDLR